MLYLTTHRHANAVGVMPPVTSVALDSLLISVYRLLTLSLEELALGPGFDSTSPAITNGTVTRIFRPCLSSCHHVRRLFSKYFQAIYDNSTYNKKKPFGSFTNLIKPWPLHKKLKVNILYLKLPSCLHSWQMTPTGSESTPSWYGLLDNCP